MHKPTMWMNRPSRTQSGAARSATQYYTRAKRSKGIVSLLLRPPQVPRRGTCCRFVVVLSLSLPLADAPGPEEPPHHADEEHGHGDGRIRHVPEDVHRLLPIATAVLAVPLGPTTVSAVVRVLLGRRRGSGTAAGPVVVVVAVGIVGREGVHVRGRKYSQ